MQCHAIVLDTTGTTYARQQPRYCCCTLKYRKNERQRSKKTEKKKRHTYVTTDVLIVRYSKSTRYLVLGTGGTLYPR